MEITAKLVGQLREMSGAGMMDCKKALSEANGDIDEAQKILRKKGLAAAAKKAGRVASEGRVVVRTSGDGRNAVILEVNSETDFVAKNEDFRAFCDSLLDRLVGDAAFAGAVSDDAAPLLESKDSSDPALTLADRASQLVAKIGENIRPRRYVRFDPPAGSADSVVGTYLHGDGKIGVLVELVADAQGSLAKPSALELSRDLAMHVAASEPRFTRRDEVTEATIATEREIAAEQARKTGKPEAVVEKIVLGRVEKFYGEAVLLEQQFVKNADLTVEKHVAAVGRELGANLKISRFVRFKLGEGIQKTTGDFAAEVAAMTASKA